MKNLKSYLSCILLAAMAAVLTVKLMVPQTTAKLAKTETAYERVTRTGVLRCAYFSRVPSIIKDPQTGQLYGIFYDYVNQLGKSLALKVDWVEEVGLGEYPAALNSGRVDAFCGAAYVTGARARGNDFVMPVYYLPLYAFVRADDHRFNDFKGDIDVLNNSEYSMAVLEGGATSVIQQQNFPKTKAYEYPQLTSPAELFAGVAQGKADIAVYDLITFNEFNAHNPGKLKQLPSAPIKIYPNVMAVKTGKDALRQMLSNATLDLLLSGTIEKILQKHEKYPQTIYRVALPYTKN